MSADVRKLIASLEKATSDHRLEWHRFSIDKFHEDQLLQSFYWRYTPSAKELSAEPVDDIPNKKLIIQSERSFFCHHGAGKIYIFFLKEIGSQKETYYYLVLQAKDEAQPLLVENFQSYQYEIKNLHELVEKVINNYDGFIQGIIEDLS